MWQQQRRLPQLPFRLLVLHAPQRCRPPFAEEKQSKKLKPSNIRTRSYGI
jgi:hypothetical protein